MLTLFLLLFFNRKTSDLIPLCHPLPLDKVQLDIRLETPSVVVISCECRVTHKTGVEMEVRLWKCDDIRSS